MGSFERAEKFFFRSATLDVGEERLGLIDSKFSTTSRKRKSRTQRKPTSCDHGDTGESDKDTIADKEIPGGRSQTAFLQESARVRTRGIGLPGLAKSTTSLGVDLTLRHQPEALLKRHATLAAPRAVVINASNVPNLNDGHESNHEKSGQNDRTNRLGKPCDSPVDSNIIIKNVHWQNDGVPTHDNAADVTRGADVTRRADVTNGVDDSDSDSDHNNGDNDLDLDPRLAVEEEFKRELKRVEKELEHNWLIDAELLHLKKKFERRKLDLAIPALPADDDPDAVIARRMDEVRSMSKPPRDTRYVLERIQPQQKEAILRVHHTPLSALIQERRRGWKMKNLFQWAVSMVRLILRGFKNRKKYFIEKTGDSQVRKKIGHLLQGPATGSGRSSLGKELLESLSKQPHLRTDRDIKHVTWTLQTTKAFKQLFPEEMEKDLARHVSYEKYDDGRILSYQGCAPDRLYYILSGRVGMLRQYYLSTSQVSKWMGLLSKGATTDPEELRRGWRREDGLVAKGQVEVLLLDKKNFLSLQHSTDGPPLPFLSSLELFEDFPLARLSAVPEAVDHTYYGDGKIILMDSNRSPWLHVVKSGHVKVVRHQAVIDVQTSPVASPLPLAPGTSRKATSHADAMLGVQAQQKQVKASRETSLPKINSEKNGLVSMRCSPAPRLSMALDTSKGMFLQTPVIYRNNRTQTSAKSRCSEENGSDGPLAVSSVSSLRRPRQMDSSGTMSSESHRQNRLGQSPNARGARTSRQISDRGSPRHLSKRRELKQREAYVQLDVLNPGDVFGLDHMQKTLASEHHGLSLVSDGAEVLRINKKIFLRNADNNTMLKIERMYKEYVSEEDARRWLYNKETWGQYKSAVWQSMFPPLPRVCASRR